MGTYDPIRWEGPLARIESPTGDRRQFPRDTLTYQSFPQPLRWQKQGMAGHNGAVTVGVIKAADERDVDAAAAARYGIEPGRYVWGHGYFLDPNVIGEVNEAVHQVEHGVSGPSVDLDSFTAVISKTLAGETVANMKRGRQRAATLVSVPAFADLRIKITRPDVGVVASAATDAVFAVNSTGWHGSPIAPREALFNADHAAKRIEGWANGDPAKMAKMFLWVDTANGPLLGRTGYRLPWGDIVDGKPYLIFHAVYAAAALLEGGHGGLPHIPDDEKNKLRTVVSSIYEQMAREFDDASIMAPWDRRRDEAQQQASGQPEPEPDDEESEYQETEEYAAYLASYDAALTGFGHHRYKERLHPRDPRRNDHAGEWVDVPKHDAHGRIKVGSKWVYPPKKGEKGYSNPEASVRAKAKRGAGTKVAHKAEKPSPDKASRPHAAPSTTPAKKAPAAKKVAAGDDKPSTQEHVDALRQMDGSAQRAYLRDLDDDQIDSLLKGVDGKRLDDDGRDDLETEILHKVNKKQGEDTGEAERKKDQERARGLREISHKDGGKTTVAKKKAPESEKKDDGDSQAKVAEKKTPAKKAATRVVAKKTGEAKEHKLTEPQERALKTLRFDEDSRIHPATRKVLTREGFLDENGKLTDKGRGGDKAPEKKAAETEVKVPEKRTTAAKKASESPEQAAQRVAKELADAETREDVERIVGPLKGAHLREVEANAGVTSRGTVAERKARLVDATMIRKGIKTPEKKTPEKKVPEKKTTVGKKTPVAKLTAAQHKEKLDQIESRDEADTYLAGVKGKDLTDLETELGMGHSGPVAERRKRIAERTVGGRSNSEAVPGGKKDAGDTGAMTDDEKKKIRRETLGKMMKDRGMLEGERGKLWDKLSDEQKDKIIDEAAGSLVDEDHVDKKTAKKAVADAVEKAPETRSETEARIRRIEEEDRQRMLARPGAKEKVVTDAMAYLTDGKPTGQRVSMDALRERMAGAGIRDHGDQDTILEKMERDGKLDFHNDKRDRVSIGSGKKREPAKKVEPKTPEPEKVDTAKTAQGQVVAGNYSKKPKLENNWGGGAAEGKVQYHPDGFIGGAVQSLGPDAALEVDGDRLDNVLGKIATEAVQGDIDGDEQVAKLRALAARLPAGRAKNAVTRTADSIDAPRRERPSTEGAPKPLADLMDELMKFPLARGGSQAQGSNRSEVTNLAEVLKEWREGRLSRGRLQMALHQRVFNQHHESQEGKVGIDRAIAKAMAELEAMVKNGELKNPGKAETPEAGVGRPSAVASPERQILAQRDHEVRALRNLTTRSARPSDSRRHNPQELTGVDEQWHEKMVRDTGPDGVAVRNLTVMQGAEGVAPYTVGSGRAWHINGVSYLIEDGVPGDRREILKALRDTHWALPPGHAERNRSYAVLAGANPADDYWGEKYHTDEFKSAMTAGEGRTDIWRGGTLYSDVEGIRASLRHEFGHNVSGEGDNALHNSPRWFNATNDDIATEWPTGLQWHLSPSTWKPVKPNGDALFPQGVSEYGQSSRGEDFGESVQYYLSGPIGSVTRGGRTYPVYFRDLFPARARILDELFPEAAKIQQDSVTSRGRIPA
jgi:hypothetical protein